jgi:hypothetical protein
MRIFGNVGKNSTIAVKDIKRGGKRGESTAKGGIGGKALLHYMLSRIWYLVTPWVWEGSARRWRQV